MDEIKIEKDRKRRQFILEGNVMAVVLYVSLPLILLNAFSYASGIIDTVVVSQSDNDALSSVVMIDQIKNLFTALGSGIATGGSIIVSRLIGRNDFTKAKEVANTVLTTAFFVAVGLVALLSPFAKLILRWGGLTENLINVGIGYFTVQIITIGVSVFNSVFLGMEKARGATLNILVVNLVVMALKILLTVLFVPVLHLGTTMVAVATLIANLTVTFYAVIQLTRRNYLFRYNVKNNHFTKQYMLPFVNLAVPVFLGKFVFSMGKVIVNSLAVGYGEDAPGALGVSNQISGSITNMTGSTEDSSSSVISQNLGALQYERMLKAFFCTLTVNLALATVGVALLTVFTDEISMFFANESIAKAELIKKIFSYEKIGIVALGINSAVNGLIYGLGYTKLSMLCNLSRLFVFRIPAMLVMINFFPNLGAESLGIAMCVSNCGIGLMSVVIGIVCLLKVKNHKTKDAVKI